MRIAILGAGSGAHTAAADLSSRGFEVNLYELPSFEKNIEPILKRGGIEVVGVKEGFVKLGKVTTDIKEAIEDVDLVMPMVPAYGHKPMAEFCAPYLKDGQIVVLTPGSVGGALEFAKTLKEKGVKKDIILGETSTLPYACRLIGPAKVHLYLIVKRFLVAAFPGKSTPAIFKVFQNLYPAAVAAVHVLETSLACGNPVIHPAATLLNAGRIEYSRGEFYMYKEGVTPSVARLIEAVDKERISLGKALGINVIPEPEQSLLQGYTHKATYYEGYSMSDIFTAVKGPRSLQDRYITEDVAYGLVFWASLGDMLGVPTPVCKALIQLASIVHQTDYWREGKRTVEKLGISGMSAQELNRFLAEGR